MYRLMRIRLWDRLLVGAAAALMVTGTALAQSNQSSESNRQSAESSRQSNSDNNYGSNQGRSGRRNAERDRRRSDRDSWDSRDSQSRQRDSVRGSRNSQDDRDAGLGVTVIETNQPGAYVIHVHRNSPAEEMGIREHDRITRVNGQRIDSAQDLISRVRSMQPGSDIDLKVDRDEGERDLSGTLESRQEALVSRSERRSQQDWQPDDRNHAANDRSHQSDRDFSGSEDLSRCLDSIERQISRLNNELEDVRSSLRSEYSSQLRQSSRDFDRSAQRNNYQSSGRHTASYGSAEGSAASDRSQSHENQSRRNWSDGDYDSGHIRENDDPQDTIGGDVGGARQEPGIENELP